MKASPDLLVLPCDAISEARKLRPDIPLVARCMDLWGFGQEIATAAHPGGFTTEGQVRAAGAGQAIHQLPDKPMVMRNPSSSARLKFVLFQVGPEGPPLIVPVK
jgi:hypothetical protein